jgi:Na+-driven multidrug efflux pump
MPVDRALLGEEVARPYSPRENLRQALKLLVILAFSLGVSLVLRTTGATCNAASKCLDPILVMFVVGFVIFTPMVVYSAIRHIRDRPGSLGVTLFFVGVFFVMLIVFAYRVYRLTLTSP